MIAIVLNGTSSSGKTSIAKSIQKISDEAMLHVSLDSFTGMFDWNSVKENERKESHRVGISNFHKCLPILASSRFPLIIDHVFEKDGWLVDTFKALEGKRTLFVGIHCPLKVLEERERNRGDRRLGLAKFQIDLVHEKKTYDLELDTSELGSDECAKRILERIKENNANQSVLTTPDATRPTS